jgi:hypothetical protein
LITTSNRMAPMVALAIAATRPAPRWMLPRQHPAADEGADHSDNQIADQTEAGALHDLPGQPAGDDTDQQNDQQTSPT